ncbi:MAG TPA: hypothetical protein VGQ50_04435 [Actinomycetota bacterium]|nr:hypothetical protein [Actinomycetota bacterium]
MARSFALLVALALGAISCSTGDPSPAASAPAASVTDPRFTRVSAYGVSAEVPGDWVVTPADDEAFATGVSATPGPGRLVPGEQGLLATRVDATEVGAPSDLYYLAAKGPMMAQIQANRRCTVTGEHVYADHAPAAITGRAQSPGDFVASATGTCSMPHHQKTRWSYFVAAPGFGPAQGRGIPGSGLYMIMAATDAAPGSSHVLHRLVQNVRFGQDGVADFVRSLVKTPV